MQDRINIDNSSSLLDKIIDIKNKADFDFRQYVNPKDELAYLFEDWVDYYKLKYSICLALQPKSILEIGVRYGYSAIAFLSASREASYLGIDNDSNTFGGRSGSVNWAKKITGDYKAVFLNADTQKMQSLPGGEYDFIHVDGQQDGDGTFHDLELAIEKGKYILLDGFFWSQVNMLASSYFMKKYSQFIEYGMIIPGYAGELLIKINKSIKFIKRGTLSYSDLSAFYDSSYYLDDHSGGDVFKRTGGSELDEGLSAVYSIADPHPDQRILDLGFGRGELAYAMAQTGADVHAIDYSAIAVKIARETFDGSKLKLNYTQDDVCKMEFDYKFDRIVASNIIEHIDADSLDKMLDKVSNQLASDGLFIIHTASHLLRYKHVYQKQRNSIRNLGSWLPINPRSYYEDILHINEQTPSRLKRTLKKHFPHVVTWACNLNDIGQLLFKKMTKSEFCSAGSIFSITSHAALNLGQIAALISQQRLDTDKIGKVELMCKHRRLDLNVGEKIQLPLTIINKGTLRLSSFQPYPIHLSYHWRDGHGNMVVFDGIRTRLRIPLLPGVERTVDVEIIAPDQAGQYQIELTMVQEQCFWLDEIVPSLPVVLAVDVH